VLRYQIGVVAIATALAFALNFALAPYFGVAGILSGAAAAAFLVVIPASAWRIWRWATPNQV
jgi:hypothetical protein